MSVLLSAATAAAAAVVPVLAPTDYEKKVQEGVVLEAQFEAQFSVQLLAVLHWIARPDQTVFCSYC
jgi:hypothetical protein